MQSTPRIQIDPCQQLRPDNQICGEGTLGGPEYWYDECTGEKMQICPKCANELLTQDCAKFFSLSIGILARDPRPERTTIIAEYLNTKRYKAPSLKTLAFSLAVFTGEGMTSALARLGADSGIRRLLHLPQVVRPSGCTSTAPDPPEPEAGLDARTTDWNCGLRPERDGHNVPV